MNFKEYSQEWFEDGQIDEVAFCENFLQRMPLKCINGIFFSYDGMLPDSEVEKEIYRFFSHPSHYPIKIQFCPVTLQTPVNPDSNLSFLSADRLLQLSSYTVGSCKETGRGFSDTDFYG